MTERNIKASEWIRFLTDIEDPSKVEVHSELTTQLDWLRSADSDKKRRKIARFIESDGNGQLSTAQCIADALSIGDLPATHAFWNDFFNDSSIDCTNYSSGNRIGAV